MIGKTILFLTIFLFVSAGLPDEKVFLHRINRVWNVIRLQKKSVSIFIQLSESDANHVT